jgi:hypothetical protein
VLSSRQKSREEGKEKDRKDVQRFNKSFEGSPVTLNTGGGRQPVDETHNYEFSVYYPSEVEYEHRVKLQVRGANYRAYSQGAAGGGDHTHSVSVTHPSHDHSVTVTHPGHDHSVTIPDHQHDVTYTVPQHTHEVLGPSDGNIYDILDTGETDGHTHTYAYPEVTDIDQESEENTTTSDSGGGTTETSSTELGSTQSTTSSTELGTTNSETSDASGDHTHEPNPGIIDFPEHPSNCDVLVNGQSVGVSLGDGSGPFEATVDIAGLLTPGQWNTIEISSESLGHLQAHLDIDVYRQILGDG